MYECDFHIFPLPISRAWTHYGRCAIVNNFGPSETFNFAIICRWHCCVIKHVIKIRMQRRTSSTRSSVICVCHNEKKKKPKYLHFSEMWMFSLQNIRDKSETTSFRRRSRLFKHAHNSGCVVLMSDVRQNRCHILIYFVFVKKCGKKEKSIISWQSALDT